MHHLARVIEVCRQYHLLRGYPVRTLSKNLPAYHQVDINYPYNAT